MTTSGLRGISFSLWLPPLECVEVQFIDIVEGSALIIDSSVSSENDDFIFEVGHRVVGTRLWSSNFAHCILGRSLGFLIGRLGPLKGSCIE